MTSIAAPPVTQIERRGAPAWLAWAGVTCAAALAWAGWVAAGEPAGPSCLFRQLTHLDCPTCGMTRALALLTAGDWRASLALHPWAAPLVLQVLGGWLAWTRWLFRRGPNFARWIPAIVATNAAVLLAIWVGRLVTGTLPG